MLLLNKSIPEIPSPLFYRDIVYLVRNGGILAAIDSATGEQLYRERVSGSGQYSASPISANGHIFLVSNRGQVSTIKPGRKFEQIHSYEIGESVFVTPAIDSNTIYFRGQKKLWAFRNSEWVELIHYHSITTSRIVYPKSYKVDLQYR